MRYVPTISREDRVTLVLGGCQEQLQLTDGLTPFLPLLRVVKVKGVKDRDRG